MWGIGCVMGELIGGKPLFPGENDLHQLCVIQEIIGPLASKLINEYCTHPIFREAQIMEHWQPETLDKHFMGKLTGLGLDLLKGLLDLDPERRLTSEQAFKHPYFDRLNNIFEIKSPSWSGISTNPSSSIQLPKIIETGSVETRLSRKRPVSNSARSR